ncbi:MAG: alpha/beta fold hydrolase [Candidatus Hodarchaeales archaeon]
MTISSSWLTTKDGFFLHFFEVKPHQVIKESSPVLLIHGWAASSLALLALAQELAERSLLVFVLDLRGHGFSEKGSTGTVKGEFFSLRTFLEDLNEFIQKKGFDKVTIVGFSMGGVIGQLYALKRPEKVDNLVLISSAYRFRLPLYLKAVIYLPTRIVTLIKSQLPRFFTRFLIGTVEKTIAEYLADGLYRVNFTIFRESLRQLKAINLKEQVEELAMPVLLISGTRDPIVDARDVQFYGSLDQIKIALFPRLSHLAFFEELETSINILVSFLLGKDEEMATRSLNN